MDFETTIIDGMREEHRRKCELPERKELLLYLHNMMLITGRSDIMYCNSFLSEATQLLINAIFLYEDGYFDCAFYSVRQASEVFNTMLYLSEEKEQLTTWRTKERFPMDSTIKRKLEKMVCGYQEIKTVLSDYFSYHKELIDKSHKIIHKQGFDTFYITRLQEKFPLEEDKNFFVEILKYTIVVHPDGHNGSGNIHAHIVANSVRKYEAKAKRWHEKRCEYRQGGKHKCTNAMLRAGKQWVMDECRAWGLHQVDLFSTKVRDDYWVRQRGLASDENFLSDKEQLRTIIDSVIDSAKDFDDFVANLKEQYSVECRITNKTISFKLPKMKQPIRGKRLGDEYDKERIVQRLVEQGVYVNAEFLDEKSMCDSYITAQAYPEVAMDVEQKAMAELQKRPQPPDWKTAMRDFARKNAGMDTEELITSFYTEYNKLWDEYNAREDRRRIKKIQR